MSQGKEKQPPGGFDSTPLRPTSGPTYTVKFTFHRAVNIPVSDYASRSSDPYVTAQVNTGLPTRHPQDPPVRFRSQTVHKSLKPEWNSVWVVAGLPERGFELSVHVWDEDPDDHDDRLGKFKVETGRLSENWKGYKEEEFKIRKTGANVRAYTLRWARKIFCRDVDLHGYLIMSMEVIGKTEEEVGKAYTVNNFWWQHYSPLIGRVAGVKTKGVDGVERFESVLVPFELRCVRCADLELASKPIRFSFVDRCRTSCIIDMWTSGGSSEACSKGPAFEGEFYTKLYTTSTRGYTTSTPRPSMAHFQMVLVKT